jgi:hypothetical protein
MLKTRTGSAGWIRRALVAAAMLSPAAQPFAAARAQGYMSPLGSLRLSFQTDRLVETREVEPLQIFDFFLIVDIDFGAAGHPEWNPSSGISAYELGVAIPPSVAVEHVEFIPLSSTPWEIDAQAGELPLLVSFTNTCVFAAGSPQVLVHFKARLLTDVRNVFLYVTACEPSSFREALGGPGPVPGWRRCPAVTGELYPFADYTAPQQFAINRGGATGVPTAAASWGELKAAFHR